MAGDRPPRPRPTPTDRLVLQQVHAAQTRQASDQAVVTDVVAGLPDREELTRLGERVSALEQQP